MEASKEALIPDNKEISILYNYLKERWNRNEIIIDDVFTYAVPTQILKENDDNDWDTKPRSINECRQRENWTKWESAIKAKLESSNKRCVFRPIVQTLKDVNHVGYKWVFVRKMNEINETTRYKARWWHKVSCKNLGLIIRKHTPLLWI